MEGREGKDGGEGGTGGRDGREGGKEEREGGREEHRNIDGARQGQTRNVEEGQRSLDPRQCLKSSCR